MGVAPLLFGIHSRALSPSLATLLRVLFWKDYYFIYNHRLLFVIGLVISRSLTDTAIISALTWYFTDHGDDLVKSAILTNIRGSLSSIFMIFMSNAAHSNIGRFNTVLFSNIAYIGALMLFWNCHPYDVNLLLVIITLVLLALGTSGDKLLEDALQDLVNDVDNSPDRNQTRSIKRATIWSCLANVSGGILAILFVAPGTGTDTDIDTIGGNNSSWTTSFIICTIAMTLAAIIFGFGHNVYQGDHLTKRPVEVFCGVIQARIKKLLNYNLGSPKNLDTEKGENEDKRNTSSSNTQEDMLVMKSLLRMFPMWGVFFVVSIISATGSAFFLQQYSNLRTHNDTAVQIYSLVQEFSSFAISLLYPWICCLRKEDEKVKIGVGMLCGIVSCIFAWQLEIYRLKEVGHLVNKKASISTSISFLWLVPQFCVLGCMKGLTRDGLLKFFKSRLKEEQLQGYREEYIEFVMGIGKLLNVFLIFILKGWFGDTINDSRLDKYYLVLVGVGSANLMAYCCIARCFYKDQDLANDEVEQDDWIEQFIDIEQNQDSDDKH